MSNKTIARVLCSCKNEFQDKLYGTQVRVANLTQKGAGAETKRVVRCTVCSKEHIINSSQLR